MHKFNKLLFFSAALHLLLLLVLSHQFHQRPLPSIKEKKKAKPIQATLYYPPVKKQLPIEVEGVAPKQEQVKPRTEKVKATKTITKVTKKTPLKNEKAKILSKQSVTKTAETSDSSTNSISQDALDKLHQRLNKQARDNSNNDSYNQYIKDKNTIAPSITKFNQLPEPKAETREVDCNASAFSTAVVVASNLLGGSIRCNRMPNLKEFLKKRAEEKL